MLLATRFWFPFWVPISPNPRLNFAKTRYMKRRSDGVGCGPRLKDRRLEGTCDATRATCLRQSRPMTTAVPAQIDSLLCMGVPLQTCLEICAGTAPIFRATILILIQKPTRSPLGQNYFHDPLRKTGARFRGFVLKHKIFCRAENASARHVVPEGDWVASQPNPGYFVT